MPRFTIESEHEDLEDIMNTALKQQTKPKAKTPRNQANKKTTTTKAKPRARAPPKKQPDPPFKIIQQHPRISLKKKKYDSPSEEESSSSSEYEYYYETPSGPRQLEGGSYPIPPFVPNNPTAPINPTNIDPYSLNNTFLKQYQQNPLVQMRQLQQPQQPVGATAGVYPGNKMPGENQKPMDCILQ